MCPVDSGHNKACHLRDTEGQEVLRKINENHAAIIRLERTVMSVAEALDRGSDKLVNALVDATRQRDMVPVSTLKWIVIFLLIFTFALIFGVEAVKTLFHSASGGTVTLQEETSDGGISREPQ